MRVRPARPAELAAVMTAFDAGGLDVAAGAVRAGVRDGRVLVVGEGPVLGALLLEPTDVADVAEIAAVAVLPARRGQGLGTALVARAAARHDALVAEFDARVRGFWTALGFAVGPAAEPGRLRGRLEGSVDRA